MDKSIMPWTCTPQEIKAMPKAEYEQHKRNEIKYSEHLARQQVAQRKLNQSMKKANK